MRSRTIPKAKLVDGGPLGKGVQHHLGTTLLFLLGSPAMRLGCPSLPPPCPQMSGPKRRSSSSWMPFNVSKRPRGTIRMAGRAPLFPDESPLE